MMPGMAIPKITKMKAVLSSPAGHWGYFYG